MAQQMIVAVFDSVNVAERAGRDFRNFEKKTMVSKSRAACWFKRTPQAN